MKRLLTMLTAMIVFVANIAAQSQSGEISGTVVDDKNEAVFGAIVQVTSGGITKGGAVTDENGEYVIKPLAPGRYDMKVNYSGYKENITKEILVAAGRTTKVNVKMEVSSSTVLNEVVIKEYAIPLIDMYSGGSSTTFTAEEIEKMPTRNTSSIVTTSAGVYPARESRAERKRAAPPKPVYMNPSVESYKKNPENDFKTVSASPLSTMSIDVDRASYSNVRRFINGGQLPPADAVRIEEMVNYFHYDYEQPKGDNPIAITTELTDCPWEPKHQLIHIGMQAKTLDIEALPPSNIVFLIDVSGSMSSSNKLPLVIQSMKMLAQNLREKDRIAIVVYAGSAGQVLPSTPGSHKAAIYEALDKLQAGGSTAGGAGIKLAYSIATDNYVKGGNNRIILATDGDFNVGISGDNELEELITKEREKGIYLTCLGYGMGNYKDSKLEVLADKGNGNYAYIDNEEEAKKTLVKEFGGTVFTLAKDVKAQIEFNPTKVRSYRLVGYENRILNTEDFKDDKKDAGDMGSGHSVTIIYEIIPMEAKSDKVRPVDDLKYQRNALTDISQAHELATVKFRYKKPNGKTSTEMTHIIGDTRKTLEQANTNVRFATSVAMFGMLLKDSKYKGEASYEKVLAYGKNAKGADEDGYRSEYLELVKKAKKMAGKQQEKEELVGWFAEEE